ncbi:NFACT RNA binding domain-containing protein [Metabacillus litoralis]|uniref:Rqc2 family fibronectin-binding protein n=1 Tax=Metabacillus TaxID=2675233 RepID=UPI000EF586B1|nr:NFACT RNA binding domain-containing protein [Metabacillus litoralis]MCM3409025.1 NFACT RNA binding domain-containing protein [Metabacillus litoralis]UHA59345.1 NFACT RNA binding domain-containing protein [Metabacillus litoralis]
MSFDGLFTYAITEELKSVLLNGKITKIHQPYKYDLIFQVRSAGKNHKLFLSAHPSYARIHLTNENYENPSEPPMFCMLLRKHLEGGVIEKIEQPEMERIIIFDIRSRNELGDITVKRLMVEIMGRHSNIILVDKDREMILDSVKHLSPAVNRHRTVLPGHPYVLPPGQEKVNPLGADEDLLLRKLDFNAGRIDQQLVQNFAGISPLFAKEVTFRAGLVNRKTLPNAFLDILSDVKEHKFEPTIYELDNREQFYMIRLAHLTEAKTKSFSTISETLDRYYYGKAERDRVKQQGNDLERFMVNEKKKNEKKIKKLAATLDQAEKASEFQLYGELITANIYAISKGDKQAEVINYYDEENNMMTIPLDVQKTPSENAQKYFSKYQKAKNSVEVVHEQIDIAQREIDYFDSLIQQIESASPKDIEEIREELIEGAYLKQRQSKNLKKKKSQKPVLEHYSSSDGTEIIVGKNNKQNEYLTNKFAARDDIWLHTKDIPGSHVVIRSSNPSEETILEAANIAAYFSKARSSSSVPVDFTTIRHVKKPSGSKPGYVIYDHQQTVYVTPNEDLVFQLRKG